MYLCNCTKRHDWFNCTDDNRTFNSSTIYICNKVDMINPSETNISI